MKFLKQMSVLDTDLRQAANQFSKVYHSKANKNISLLRGQCTALTSAMNKDARATKLQTEKEFKVLEHRLQLSPSLSLLKQITHLRVTLKYLPLGQVEKALVRLKQLYNNKGNLVDRMNHYLEQSGVPQLQPSDLLSLNAPITEEELMMTFKTLPTYKSPGPDGLLYEYYKSFLPRCFRTCENSLMLYFSKLPFQLTSRDPFSP